MNPSTGQSRSGKSFDTRAVVGVLVYCLLTACGGGSGGGESNPPPAGGVGCKVCPPSLGEIPYIGWLSTTVSRLDFPVHGTLAIDVTVIPSLHGLDRAEFFVDELLVESKPAPFISATNFATMTFDWATAALGDGYHVIRVSLIDKIGQRVNTSPRVVRTQQNISGAIAMTTSEIFPRLVVSNANGAGSFQANLSTGAISGFVTLANINATSVHIHDGGASLNGDAIVTLAFDGGTNRWVVPTGTTLTASPTFLPTTSPFPQSQTQKLNAGALYIDAHSASYPNGEVRAQLLPGQMKLVSIYSANQPTAMTMPSTYGVVSVTADATANLLRVDLHAVGGSTANSLPVIYTSTGNVAFLVTNLATNHWTCVQELQLAMRPDLGSLHVDIGGSNSERIIIPTTIYPTVPTFDELQSTIFTPKCSSCHTGVGSVLPGSLNLTAGSSYAALVDNPSRGQPLLTLVRTNEPGLSYLIHKLVGAASNLGDRMPLNGPYLSDAEIQSISTWIEYGAKR